MTDSNVMGVLRSLGVPEFAVLILALIAVLSIFAAIPLGIWAMFASRKHKLSQQKLRDLEATEDGEFVLYLRPFFSDRRVWLPNPFTDARGYAADGPGIGPEEFVGRCIETFLPVRQVGGSPDTIGASRVMVGDDAWRAAVIDAVKRARAIVIMPLVTKEHKKVSGEATLWELEYLVTTGAISKTVVLMPYGGLLNRFRISRAWKDVRTRALTFALDLPKFHVTGEAITFKQDRKAFWRVASEYGRKGNTYWRLGQGLLSALADLRVIPPRHKDSAWSPMGAGAASEG